MARARKYKVTDYAKALEMADGYPSHAAKILDVTPSALSKAMERHPSLKKLREQLERDRVLPALDVAESELYKALQDGKAWAIKYFLDNHGADRGFGKKLELSGKVDGEVSEADPIKKLESLPADIRRRKLGDLMERARARMEQAKGGEKVTRPKKMTKIKSGEKRKD